MHCPTFGFLFLSWLKHCNLFQLPSLRELEEYAQPEEGLGIGWLKTFRNTFFPKRAKCIRRTMEGKLFFVELVTFPALYSSPQI